ncbi:hypothetical protein VNO77_44048 [Canavalia gladiata]|uniref:Uncharacterized protein n=1 Tax=Canavalia gladiata TaxID=3824 RepID=A0AAN9JY80_CANGL
MTACFENNGVRTTACLEKTMELGLGLEQTVREGGRQWSVYTYEDDNGHIREKLKAEPPTIPMEIRVKKAINAIYVCCFGKDPLQKDDERLLTAMPSAVFPTVQQEEIQRLIKDKAEKEVSSGNRRLAWHSSQLVNYLRMLAIKDYIQPLCDLLDCLDSKIVTCCLECGDSIFAQSALLLIAVTESLSLLGAVMLPRIGAQGDDLLWSNAVENRGFKWGIPSSHLSDESVGFLLIPFSRLVQDSGYSSSHNTGSPRATVVECLARDHTSNFSVGSYTLQPKPRRLLLVGTERGGYTIDGYATWRVEPSVWMERGAPVLG